VPLYKESERFWVADEQRDARGVAAIPIEQASVPFYERDPITTTTRRGAGACENVFPVGKSSSSG
jgi:hypothetical protein